MSDSISPNSPHSPGYGFRKDPIAQMLRQGYSYREIAKELNCSRSTISYHAKNLRLRNMDLQKSSCRYDWDAVQQYHDEGHSPVECASQFGFCLGSWTQAVKTGKIVPHYQQKRLLESLLIYDQSIDSVSLKKKMIEAGLLEYKCKECSISKWNGRPIVLQLDHINGDHNDNRIENLRLLCPNCHTQTETYGSKNRKSYRETKDIIRKSGSKRCIQCKETKSLEEFYIRNDLKDGRQNICKACAILRARERRAKARKH